MNRQVGFFALGVGVTTLLLYLLAHVVQDADARSFQRDRAIVTARAVAWTAERELAKDIDKGTTQDLVSSLAKTEHLEEALVLVRTKFLAHTDPERAGARLDRESLSDKALFDAARAMKADVGKNLAEREKHPELDREPYPTASTERADDGVIGRVPASAAKFRAMAQVRVPSDTSPAPFPIFLAVFGLVAAVLLIPIQRLIGGLGTSVSAVALFAIMFVSQLDHLQGWRDALRLKRVDEMGKVVSAIGKAGLVRASYGATADLSSSLSLDEEGRATGRVAEVRSSTVASTTRPDEVRRVEEGDVVVDTALSFLSARAEAERSTIFRWGLAAGLIGLGFLLLGFSGHLERAAQSLYRHRAAYAYMSPAMLGLLVLVFIPVTYGVALSFQSRVYNEFQFVGFQNYLDILSDGDIMNPRNFYFTLGVTVMWTISNEILHVGIGLGLALLLNDQMLKAKGIYRVILVVPWAIPNYITALIWKSMFHKQFGAVNAFLEVFGVEDMSWFQTFWPAFTANVATNTWLGFPFMMVVSLGALQSIPTDLYEAARVDGASRWQRFSKITFPLLLPALVPAVIVGTVWTFNMFNIIYLVSGGAPNGGTDILITEAYRWAFEFDRPGYAAAYSMIIFLILLAFTLVTNRITGATKGAFE